MDSLASPYLEIHNISKQFGATTALKNVSLSLYPGEVHALLGENGAGKSTLIKIMTGIYQPDSGEILIEGRYTRLHNSAQAQAHKIAAIYQEPLVFPDLNIAENIFISHRQRGFGMFVNWGKMYRDAKKVLQRLDVTLDVRAQARGLPLAAQQTVEIAKAISMDVRVLIMDEPTASLSAHEVEQLFNIVRTLRDQGVAILFISHRLDEVFKIADRITIFRDGELISSRSANEVTREGAIRDMVGRPMGAIFQRESSEIGDVALSVRDLKRRGNFEDISFDLHAGEVLGFAGLVGAGRTDVALALFGIAPAHGGQISFGNQEVRIESLRQVIKMGIAYLLSMVRARGGQISFNNQEVRIRSLRQVIKMGIAYLLSMVWAHGGQISFNTQDVKIHSPRQAIKMGIAYLPEDRRENGLVLPMSITSNITLPIMQNYANLLGVINNQRERQIAEEFREKLSIRTPSISLPVRKLSGGNQQKVVLSKWLNTVPRVLILDEPTRGIDVGAKEEVHRLIDQLAQQGMAILLISSDLPEVMAMSDHILVMREGRQMGIFNRAEASQEQILGAAMGQFSLERGQPSNA